MDSYTVIFQDFDSSILKTQEVRSGKPASPPEEPKRDGYIFAGWDKDFMVVTENMIVKAEYLRITNTKFRINTVTSHSGVDRVEVPICIVNNPGILGMRLSISYDETIMKLKECRSGIALSALTFIEPSVYTSGCNFLWYGSEIGEIVDGEMLILVFEIKDNVKEGKYPIKLKWSEKDVYDYNCDLIEPQVVEGAIEIIN